MTHAAIDDASNLRRAQAPSSAQEALLKRADWRDPSPHTASFVEANGQRLEWLDWGGSNHPTTLVFLPGMGHTAQVFDELAPRFADRFRVVALTLRGHGASSAPSHPYTVDSLTADVHDSIRRLELRDVVLVGHSLGGHVANRVAALYPSSVARVIYLDAAKDSTGLAELRAAAPSTRPSPAQLVASPGRAHLFQRLLYFAFWSDGQEADFRLAEPPPRPRS